MIRRIKGKVRRVFRAAHSGQGISMSEIRSLVDRPNPTILEIGAADGQDSQRFLDTFPDPAFDLHCFEPDPRHASSLQSRLVDPRVKLSFEAVGASSGKARFYQTSTIYSSSLKRPDLQALQATWPEIDLAQELHVSVTTLDDYCIENEISRIDFLWADVQGGEDLVIQGGYVTFTERIRYFYTEYSDTAYYQDEPNLKEIRALLGDQYTLVEDYGADALFRNQSLSK